MPPCLRLNNDPALEAIAAEPLLFADARWQLTHDIAGHPLLTPIRFGLALSSDHLYFGYAQAISDGVFTARPMGTFHEGLWEEEVLELFLAADSGEGYQEFNISPSGAWWSQSFSAHRVRTASAAQDLPLEVFAETGSAGSRAFFRIKRSALAVDVAFLDRSRANVTAVSIDATTRGKRYLAYHGTGDGPPDFHSALGFQSFQYIGC